MLKKNTSLIIAIVSAITIISCHKDAVTRSIPQPTTLPSIVNAPRDTSICKRIYLECKNDIPTDSINNYMDHVALYSPKMNRMEFFNDPNSYYKVSYTGKYELFKDSVIQREGGYMTVIMNPILRGKEIFSVAITNGTQAVIADTGMVTIQIYIGPDNSSSSKILEKYSYYIDGCAHDSYSYYLY